MCNLRCLVPGATEGSRGEEDIGDAYQAKTGDRGGGSEGKEDRPRRERIVSIVLRFYLV